MDKKLVFATNNLHKLEEVRNIIGNSFEILSLSDINCNDDIPETADTFEGNALIKARHIYNKYKMNCFADDSGLEVDALDGAPGVHSARYATEGHDHEANINKLLGALNGKENRDAQFRTVAALIIDGKEYIFDGIIKGSITKKRAGNNGFGYDPVFMPKGYDKTFAQMTDKEKNSISHRAIAMNKLNEFLKNLPE